MPMVRGIPGGACRRLKPLFGAPLARRRGNWRGIDRVPKDGVLHCAAWRAWLEREALPSASAGIGVLLREDFARSCGTLLVWRIDGEDVHVALREHRGGFDPDVALVLVGDAETLGDLLAHGVAQMRPLVRRGRLQPYMLKTLDELDDAGLADFVEDLGLVFPRH